MFNSQHLPAAACLESVAKDDPVWAPVENTYSSALEMCCTSMLPPSVVLLNHNGQDRVRELPCQCGTDAPQHHRNHRAGTQERNMARV